MIIEEEEEEKTDSLELLETNLDDCTGEVLGYTMNLLLKAGANDVWYTPIYMKKNRPAYMLSVLCRESSRETMEDIIFTHTTSIGIRRFGAAHCPGPKKDPGGNSLWSSGCKGLQL